MFLPTNWQSRVQVRRSKAMETPRAQTMNLPMRMRQHRGRKNIDIEQPCQRNLQNWALNQTCQSLLRPARRVWDFQVLKCSLKSTASHCFTIISPLFQWSFKGGIRMYTVYPCNGGAWPRCYCGMSWARSVCSAPLGHLEKIGCFNGGVLWKSLKYMIFFNITWYDIIYIIQYDTIWHNMIE